MAVATSVVNTYGRSMVPLNNVAVVVVTITATATVYSSAGGGLPIDLTSALQIAAPAGFDAPNYVQALNPNDVVGATFIQLSTNGFMPSALVVGTPTYTAVPWMTSTNETGVPGILATCPATIRLFGTGSADKGAFHEVADGAVTDTFSFLLIIARSGANN